MGRTPEQDQFVSDLFDVDLSAYGTAGPSGGDADPPPPQDATPAPPAQGGGGESDTVKTLRKRIKALEVLGNQSAPAFRAEFDRITKAQKAAHEPDAKLDLDLDILAGAVGAEFNQDRAPPKPTPEQLAARKESAKKATSTAGRGDQADADLVVEQLAKMPKALIDALGKNGTKLRVCRGSVTDYLTELKGVKPRGWPAGSTWDSVPGLQQPDKKEVVIATVGHDDGTPHVPGTGEGHGSVNLVIHETAHGVDFASTPHISSGRPFNAARNPDKAALSAYESQPGSAGQEETFAESCARFYSNTPSSAQDTPHLHKYWRDNPLGPPDPEPPHSTPAPPGS